MSSKRTFTEQELPQRLGDPCNDRAVPSVVPPFVGHLDDDKLFPSYNLPDWQLMIELFRGEGKLSKGQATRLLRDALDLIQREPNCVKINFPATIIGDIHGQVFDLIYQLEKKNLGKDKLVFLGDYVDRGRHSIECLLLLLALKICYPGLITLLRGNHESRLTAEHFTFRYECLDKYDQEFYELCLNIFDAFPLAAIIGGEYLCIHGGISPALKSLKSIENINRFVEPPESGLLCDLLWADPEEDEKAAVAQFNENKTRGCSFKFGLEPLKKVLSSIGVKMLIRGHEVQ